MKLTHLINEILFEAFLKGKVIVYHNFQGVDTDENIPGTKKVLNVADCIGNEPNKDYNYFTTEKKQYVEDMIKDASGDGWKKFEPIVAIPHPVVSGKYAVIDGNHRLGAFTIGKLPQINANILSDDKIVLAEKGAEWDENKLPKTMPLADAKKKGVNLKEYFATQPLKVPSNENTSDHEKGFEERLMYRLGQKFKGDFKLVGSDLLLNGNKILTIGPLDTYNSIIRKVRRGLEENYADGKVKGKSRPGRVKKAGASCKGSVTDLRAKAKKYGGEKGKMYHWCANMKGGKKK